MHLTGRFPMESASVVRVTKLSPEVSNTTWPRLQFEDSLGVLFCNRGKEVGRYGENPDRVNIWKYPCASFFVIAAW